MIVRNHPHKRGMTYQEEIPMDNIKDCGKSSAPKKLKGFTLIELIIVMAILAILASMISILATGIVRDARLDAARSQAQSAYTAIQNTLVQLEINGKGDLLDPTTYGATSGTNSDYVILSFVMDNGNLGGSYGSTTIQNGSKTVTPKDASGNNYSYPNSNPPENDKEREFRKLAKYLTDNLDMGFTGYVYAAIDMSDWMVDSVVTIENYSKITATTPITTYVPKWGTKSGTMATASSGKIPFCGNAIQQRDIYSGKETACLDAVGTAVGFYPFLDDMDSSTVTYTT